MRPDEACPSRDQDPLLLLVVEELDPGEGLGHRGSGVQVGIAVVVLLKVPQSLSLLVGFFVLQLI